MLAYIQALVLDFNFIVSLTFSPCLTFFWWSPFALFKVIVVFSCVLYFLKSLSGVKSVLAKINLYNLLSCSIFSLLPALWEMQQAEPSFLCKIINSVAFPVHMLQIRLNGELYLCLLRSKLKVLLSKTRHRHMLHFPWQPLDIGVG